jgi:hypothetical protein
MQLSFEYKLSTVDKWQRLAITLEEFFDLDENETLGAQSLIRYSTMRQYIAVPIWPALRNTKVLIADKASDYRREIVETYWDSKLSYICEDRESIAGLLSEELVVRFESDSLDDDLRVVKFVRDADGIYKALN